MYPGNLAEFVGTIGEDIQVSHIRREEERVFYRVVLHVCRLSGTIDEVLMIVNDEILRKCEVKKGSKVRAQGRIQTRLEWDEEQNMQQQKMYVQTTKMEAVSKSEQDKNNVYLAGTLVANPNIRKTPKGKVVADFVIRTDVVHNKSFKIPCIAWKRVADFLGGKVKGDKVNFVGMFCSRCHIPQLQEGQRKSYEISVMRMV